MGERTLSVRAIVVMGEDAPIWSGGVFSSKHEVSLARTVVRTQSLRTR